MNWQMTFFIRLLIFALVFTVNASNINAQYSNLRELSTETTMKFPEYTHFATDGNILYGMTSSGGANNNGVIFKINRDGTGFQKLLDFDGVNRGSAPRGSLVLSGSVLYGMTYSGGTHNYGVIFRINTDGSGFQKLVDFDGTSKGSYPRGSLTVSGSILYGTTYNGGANGYGVLFKINSDGTGFQKLLDFGVSILAAYPTGTLAISGNTLYGMTVYAGTNAKGCVFKVSTDGTGFTRIYNFDGTNSGANPNGSLTISGSILYGMTTFGGANNLGCIFRLNTNGSNFTKLLDFNGTVNGARPYGSLFISGTTLYGMTTYGGTNDKGCVFSIKTDGTEYWKKWNLGDSIWGGYDNNGNYPKGSLILIDNELIGMTSGGGFKNAGTIFRVYDYSIRASDGVYRKLRDCYPALQGTHLTGDFVTDGTVLYGTAWDGGANNKGAIFKINKNGSNFENIYHFNTDANGYTPVSVILSGSTLYGITHDGGLHNYGIIFKMNTDGTGFQKLADFDSIRGAVPYGQLLIDGTILYGMASVGGSGNMGTVFKINTDGTGFQKLLDFDGTNKGSYPLGSLILSGSTLYGTSSRGGTYNLGVIFKINTDGSGFQKLLDFDGTNKGANPWGGNLALLGSTLYGMTQNGGSWSMGTIFKINTDGAGFQKLQDFTITNGAHPQYTSLTYYNSALYGTTYSGGTYSAGIIFKINLDGTGFEKLFDFDGTHGSRPSNSLLHLNSTLFGATFAGGMDDIGVIYKYELTDLQIDATGGMLTCTTPEININVTSNIIGVTYTWSGPNGFSSTLQNPAVSTPGDYVVAVTYGGLSKTDTAKVTQNISAPVALATGGTITCSNLSVNLTGNSSTSGMLYSWSGPLNFMSTEQNPVSSYPGVYSLTVTDPSNGCFATASATVNQDTSSAANITANVSGTITCSIPQITISGSSSTTGVTYSWTGPDGFISANQAILVSKPGTYVLQVTKMVNDCQVSTSALVLQDTVKPKNVTASLLGTLNCKTPSIILSGTSSTAGVTYSWSGPEGYSSNSQNPSINTGGSYTLLVTSPTNGCATIQSVTVEEDKSPPENITANSSGPLNCNNVFVTLTGTSTTPGSQYIWISPDNSEYEGEMMFAISAGIYKFVVTNPNNGCRDTAFVEVTLDTIAPVSNIIPLAQPVALTTNILSTQVADNVTYNWEFSSSNLNWIVISGNNSSELSFQAGDAGTKATFVLTVTNNINGCLRTNEIVLTAISSLQNTASVQTSVYPNPFSDNTTIEFFSFENTNVTLELYNSSGNLVSVLFNNTILAYQVCIVKINAENMASGIYYLIVKTNNEIQSYRLVLSK
jgi:uncharacterized repeat protein (TIGR03803 family)